jgi:hypothetical protein
MSSDVQKEIGDFISGVLAFEKSVQEASVPPTELVDSARRVDLLSSNVHMCVQSIINTRGAKETLGTITSYLDRFAIAIVAFLQGHEESLVGTDSALLMHFSAESQRRADSITARRHMTRGEEVNILLEGVGYDTRPNDEADWWKGDEEVS